MIMYSPDSTRRVYKFEVRGSNDSVLPMIWAVDAVGIGAVSNEFRAPYCTKSWRSEDQGYLSSVVVCPQSSICVRPCEKGEPLNEAYAPYFLANSTDSDRAA